MLSKSISLRSAVGQVGRGFRRKISSAQTKLEHRIRLVFVGRDLLDDVSIEATPGLEGVLSGSLNPESRKMTVRRTMKRRTRTFAARQRAREQSTSPLYPPPAAGPWLQRALVGGGSIAIIATLALAWLSKPAPSAVFAYLIAAFSAIALGVGFGHSVTDLPMLHRGRGR
jgi:hypothetical protein